MTIIAIPTELSSKIGNFSPSEVSSVLQKITAPGCGIDPIIKAANQALDAIFDFVDNLMSQGDGVFDQLTSIAGGVQSLINDVTNKALSVFASLPQIGAKLIDKVGQLLIQLLGGLNPTDLLAEITSTFPSVDLNDIFGKISDIFENVNQFDLCKIVPNIQIIDGEEVEKAIPALQSITDAIAAIEIPELPEIPIITQPLKQITSEFYEFIDSIPPVPVDIINENLNTAYKSFANALKKINVPSVINTQVEQIINDVEQQGIKLTEEFSSVLNNLTNNNQLISKLNNQLPSNLKQQIQNDLAKATSLAQQNNNQFALTQLSKIQTIIAKV